MSIRWVAGATGAVSFSPLQNSISPHLKLMQVDEQPQGRGFTRSCASSLGDAAVIALRSIDQDEPDVRGDARKWLAPGTDDL